MDGVIAHWYVLAIGGIAIFSTGIFIYKEGSKNWLVANADLTMVLSGFIIFVTGFRMLFSRI